jgi:hypothetical protein
MLRTLSLFMAWVVFLNPALAAKLDAFDSAAAAQAPDSQTQTVKDRAVQIPAGSKVEIRLIDKQKLKGRIGTVSDDGIVLKYSKAGQPEERRIAFTEMASIKKAGWGTGRKVLVGAGLAFVGAGLILGLVCWASGGGACPSN